MSLFLQQTFDDPLFALSFNPVAQSYVTGLSNGTVTAYRVNAGDGDATPEQLWTTKRHKGSCRALIHDHSGEYIFSAGSDGVIKKAYSETGKVCAKNISGNEDSSEDGENAITCLDMTESWLASGDDSGAFAIYDTRTLKVVHRYERVHEDCITSILSGIPGKNKYHYVTSGATTICDVDIRKGVVQTSEDQEDEILCGAVAGAQRLAFGMSQGVVTFWDPRRLDDQLTRIRVSENNTVDCIIAGEQDDYVVVGSTDGIVREINTRASRIEKTITHAKDDEVTLLDYDSEYRLVSANMDILNIWKKDDELSQDDLDEQKKRKKLESAQHGSKKKQKKANKKNPAKTMGINSFDDL